MTWRGANGELGRTGGMEGDGDATPPGRLPHRGKRDHLAAASLTIAGETARAACSSGAKSGHSGMRVRVGRRPKVAHARPTVRLRRCRNPLPHVRLAGYSQRTRNAGSSGRRRQRHSHDQTRCSAAHMRRRQISSVQPGNTRSSRNANWRRVVRTGEAVPELGVVRRPHAPLRGGVSGGARERAACAQRIARPPEPWTSLPTSEGRRINAAAAALAPAEAATARAAALRARWAMPVEGCCPQTARFGNRHVVRGYDARGPPSKSSRGHQGHVGLVSETPLSRRRYRGAWQTR